MTDNPLVAGTIALETRIVGKIQGIQFKGIVSKPGEELLAYAKKNLLHTFSLCHRTSLHILVTRIELH